MADLATLTLLSSGGDHRLIDRIVDEVKSQGIFDQFRKECIADVDTKPAYQNLRTRVEGSVNSFLSKQSWTPELNKNQSRENLRKHIHEAPYLEVGVERIVDQVVNPKVYSIFMPRIEDVVYEFLGIERPKSKEKGTTSYGLKDLLPKDLDPVSPESDKNSLKDVSLESVDETGIESTNEKKEKKEDSLLGKLQEIFINHDKNIDGTNNNGVTSYKENSSSSETTTIELLEVKVDSNPNLNTSIKSDDKGADEEEEDSPTFEPIDIMNLNESNVSNDSHLSGISELTSHRSRSPDFTNEFSREHLECSNQDSQLSKVSSDSRLSIITTDCGSSNHPSTPINPDTSRDGNTGKDKMDGKSFTRDVFHKSGKDTDSRGKINRESLNSNRVKEFTQNIIEETNSIRDTAYNEGKDKLEGKTNKERERNKNQDYTKTKSASDKKIHSKDLISVKSSKDKDGGDKKKQGSRDGSLKDESSKFGKVRMKDQAQKMTTDKGKDETDLTKDSSYSNLKDEKSKELDRKDHTNRDEVRDLKDLYKEKIRELREKKELTEKEKLNKDSSKDWKKREGESRDRRDASKEKKKSRKEHSSKSATGKSYSVSHQHESKESKEKRSDSQKDRTKRDEKRLGKESKSKSNASSTKGESLDKSDRQDSRKSLKNERESRSDKSDVRKEHRYNNNNNNGDKVPAAKREGRSHERLYDDGKKEQRVDSQSKEKKRKEEKKSKPKDDHSSLRKNSNDRRSTDRDGSNGSNGRSSQSSNSNSNTVAGKSTSSSLSKETNNMNNSSSETSDSVEDLLQVNQLKLSSSSSNCRPLQSNSSSNRGDRDTQQRGNMIINNGQQQTNANWKSRADEYLNESTNLTSKKRMFSNENLDMRSSDATNVKKPKFAKNIHEAKKLMKIRKKLEKRKLKEFAGDGDSRKMEERNKSNTHVKTIVSGTNKTIDKSSLENVPDDERVQIIEVPDEEYEEPYPEINPSLEERTRIMLAGESGTSNFSSVQESNPANSIIMPFEQLNGTSTDLGVKPPPPIEEPIFRDAPSTKSIGSTIYLDEQCLRKEDKHVSATAAKDLAKDTRENCEDEDSCLRFFNADSEKSTKFSNFLESVQLQESSTLEDMIESMGGQLVSSSVSKTMAPPQLKRKHLPSPLSDILLMNNTNNNNDQAENATKENSLIYIHKRRKTIVPQRQKFHSNLATAQQQVSNGENFIMPLSPESDVSATSEKLPSTNLTKEDKGRQRSRQHYSSDDLYKPRPLFSSSSRRSRRSHQA
ncbi:biorientation of chromosomes in cell division protein 1-like 1 [Prorops nasuta]|uniref:biorientation of chromosomes in cell division protein 1-like 1 n=1 Tax=Prorops nasuta TaxID=863751 RepID=UPI0034CD4F71